MLRVQRFAREVVGSCGTVFSCLAKGAVRDDKFLARRILAEHGGGAGPSENCSGSSTLFY